MHIFVQMFLFFRVFINQLAIKTVNVLPHVGEYSTFALALEHTL